MRDDDDIGEMFWPLFTALAIMFLVVGLVTAASIVLLIHLTP
jgi:hypothetical protein